MQWYLAKDIMIKLSCRELGLECDFTAEGKTEGEALKIVSEHAISVHNMKSEDIYEDDISTAFLCQAIGKMTSTYNDEKPG
jgi:predicted small metal-binding protein